MNIHYFNPFDIKLIKGLSLLGSFFKKIEIFLRVTLRYTFYGSEVNFMKQENGIVPELYYYIILDDEYGFPEDLMEIFSNEDITFGELHNIIENEVYNTSQ